MGRPAKDSVHRGGRRPKFNVHRVRWAMAVCLRLDRRELTLEDIWDEASRILRPTDARGSPEAMRKSYYRQNKLIPKHDDRAELARKWVEDWETILNRIQYKTAGEAILKQLEAGPRTVDQMVRGSGMKYRAMYSAASRLYTRRKIFRHRPGLYYLPGTPTPPPPPPNCLRALQIANRALNTTDLMRLTEKTFDAVGAEMRRLKRDLKAFQVVRASPGVCAAYVVAPASAVLPARTGRIGTLESAEAAIVRELLEANGQPRSTLQFHKKLTKYSPSAIDTALFRLVGDSKIFRPMRGHYVLSAPR